METEHEEKVKKYRTVWSRHHIDSSSFPPGHENPSKAAWAFQSESQEASRVTLGAFQMTHSQISRAGTSRTKMVNWDESNAIEETADRMSSCGMKPFEQKGDMLVSSPEKALDSENAQVGEYRVFFQYAECGLTTIIAQQI